MSKLENTTFIIPLRIESDDRMRNIITILCFLLSKFNSKVIVKEHDTHSIFSQHVLPQIKEFLGDGINNLTHIFEKSEDIVFHRTRFLNEMLNLSDTDVVVNYDCDILLNEETYYKSTGKIIDDGYDLVYPYGKGSYQQQVFANDEVVSQFINQNFNFDVLMHNSQNYLSDRGHVQFFKRSSYIEGGMENENFMAYGPEDWERHDRFVKLGYKVGRVDDIIYHFEHKRTQNSWTHNPYFNSNKDLFDHLDKLSKEELIEYYKNQKYLEKYEK